MNRTSNKLMEQTFIAIKLLQVKDRQVEEEVPEAEVAWHTTTDTPAVARTRPTCLVKLAIDLLMRREKILINSRENLDHHREAHSSHRVKG